MALTATATKTTRKCIVDSLNMKLPEVIYIPPAKNNIIYTVLDKPKDFSNYFEGIVEKLKVEGVSMHRMIIFCKTYKYVISICDRLQENRAQRGTLRIFFLHLQSCRRPDIELSKFYRRSLSRSHYNRPNRSLPSA